jgi:hypothetical protein
LYQTVSVGDTGLAARLFMLIKELPDQNPQVDWKPTRGAARLISASAGEPSSSKSSEGRLKPCAFPTAGVAAERMARFKEPHATRDSSAERAHTRATPRNRDFAAPLGSSKAHNLFHTSSLQRMPE